MKSRIIGTTLPVLEVMLEPGDRLVSEPGHFSWITGSVDLQTSALTAGAKGFFGAIGRAFAGGGLFMNEFSPVGAGGMVAFAATVPGHIKELTLSPGQSYLVHRHGFLCGTDGIELSVAFQKSLGAGLFGGEGFVLQRLSGNAKAWVELGGEVVGYNLAPGQVIRVHPGHVGLFEESVQFDITLMPGVKNALFGGAGLFLAELTGPGQVWLQTLTVPNLAHALSPYISRDAATSPTAAGAAFGAREGVPGAVAGAVVGSVLDNLFGSDK
jgi:uncharacterized protein (AIM24 family)